MQTTPRLRTSTAALALAALLSAGSVATAAPALAGPGSGHGSSHSTGQGAGKGAGKGHGGHASSATKAQRKVLKAVTQLDKRLAKVVKDSTLKKLAEADRSAVLANVGADRGELAALAEQVRAAATAAEVQSLAAGLKGARVQQHTIAAALLRKAARTAAEVAEAQAAGDSTRAADLEAAQAHVDAAVAVLHEVTMRTSRDELRAAAADLQAASQLLEDDSDDDLDDETEDETEDESEDGTGDETEDSDDDAPVTPAAR